MGSNQISRRLLTGIVLLIALLVWSFGTWSPVRAASPRSVQFIIGQKVYVLDGVVYVMDAVPMIRGGRTFVPVRFLAISLGIPESGIHWDPAERKVTLESGTTVVELVIGSPEMKVNGRVQTMDVAPEIEDGRTFLPARYISEALGFQVGWNPETQTVVIGQSQPTKETFNDLKTLAADVQRYVVLVRVMNSDGKPFSQGSGVAVGEDMVLTNVHVVQGGAVAEVVTGTGDVHVAKGLVAIDAPNDLALLKTKGANLSPAKLGDSDRLQVGEKVLTVGSPLGLQNTVSDGIVSGLREFGNRSYVQITAPISPGSSGGGVFDLKGNLIGVAVSTIKEGQNLNLAIPVNLAKKLISQREEVALPFPAGSEPKKEKATPSSIAGLLNRTSRVLSNPIGDITFRYQTLRAAGNYDIVVSGVIEGSKGYLAWLLTEQKTRMDFLASIARECDKASGGASFLVILFYQDRWVTYPSSFPSDEISLSWDGRSWLVTHMIGTAYSEEDKIRWTARP